MEQKQKLEITKLINYFKSVGFAFAKTMKQMVESGELKPPKHYTNDEYIKLIDSAYEEGIMRSAENTIKKNKKINEANNLD